MATNKRIIYPVHYVGFAPVGVVGPANFTALRGGQSVGITTNFNLENVFEMGNVDIYELIENIPDVEMTLEKVLDGYPLIMHLATKGAASPTLLGRSNVRTTAVLGVFRDTQDTASGMPISECYLSGLYWSATTFTIPVEGNATESFTGVGNNKLWIDVEGGSAPRMSGSNTFLGDRPVSISGSGGVQRREDVIFGTIGTLNAESGSFPLDVNGSVANFWTVLPQEIDGINASGVNVQLSDGNFNAPLQSITVSVNLGRENIFHLGRKTPYFRYVTIPVEVTSDIETLGTKWDNVSATEEGVLTGANAGNNLANRTIRIRMRDGTHIDLGTSNKLQSVNYSGGDTGGSNVVIRYTYSNFNNFTVRHPRDPSGFSWPT